MTFKKGHIPWSTGLTKETDFRVKNIGLASKGRTLSEEARKRISDKAKERYKDPTKNPMYGKKMVPRQRKKHSEETKKRISEIKKQKFASGETVIWIKGKKLSDSHKKKISEATKKRWENPDYRAWQQEINSGKNNFMYNKTGEQNPNWRGGISFESYGLDWTEDLRKTIFERDKHCLFQNCKATTDLNIHHIDYCKTNNNPENLMVLCRTHNAKVNYNRSYWGQFFVNLLKERKVII